MLQQRGLGHITHSTRTGALAWEKEDFDATPGVCCSSNERRGHAMKKLACWLFLAPVTAAVVASPVRVARVGEFDGKVEVQIHAADAWRPAVRNMPLVERTWVRTANTASVEMELDDGSVLRLSSDALFEFSDYTRLSTGQRVSVLSIDHGVAYFTGEPERRDAVILVVPGAQATVHTGTRLRLEARDNSSQISVLEGKVRFSSPVAEMDLSEGETARVENASRSRFFLYREIAPLDSDRWNEQRDKTLAATGSAGHVPGLRYGLADLDGGGSWMQTADLGVVWKPKVTASWTPYRDGQWLWYDELGYTWIANESWGWLPFHYGRWMDASGLGWVWSPGKSTAFKPGEVYWLREANLVGWGPLGPGETWAAASVPRLYLRRNTTLARWAQDARVLNPVDAAEKLTTSGAVFVIAPPSPAFDSARFDAIRPAASRMQAARRQLKWRRRLLQYRRNHLFRKRPPIRRSRLPWGRCRHSLCPIPPMCTIRPRFTPAS
ncbi:MAG: hypothetical protein DMG58_09740 [Acidobacteria bacterium]|nr:MAG: hypothetical protein DMG58_09740 [Acidobacteriota bacterium]